MTNAIPFILQGNNITLVVGGKSHTVSKDTHISYDKIVEALKAKDWDIIADLVDPKEVLINFSNGNLTIENSELYWKGTRFDNSLSMRIVDMYKEGFSVEPMVAFMENLMANPSKTSVDELYSFLEKNKLPITEDGHFLAYKRVDSQYKDVHSGSIDNSIGQRPSMDRNQVDDNRHNTCSQGLHFCSEEYLSCFGNANDPIMIIKINPADVVSIPSDYNNAKGRCWTYEVVGEVSGDPKNAFRSSVNNDYTPMPEPVSDDDWDDEFDDEEFPMDDVMRELYEIDAMNGLGPWPAESGANAENLAMDTDEDFDISEIDIEDSVNEPMYDLRRVNGGWVEYIQMTYDQATERMEKAAAQKKAALYMVHAGTDIKVE